MSVITLVETIAKKRNSRKSELDYTVVGYKFKAEDGYTFLVDKHFIAEGISINVGEKIEDITVSNALLVQRKINGSVVTYLKGKDTSIQELHESTMLSFVTEDYKCKEGYEMFERYLPKPKKIKQKTKVTVKDMVNCLFQSQINA